MALDNVAQMVGEMNATNTIGATNATNATSTTHTTPQEMSPQQLTLWLQQRPYLNYTAEQLVSTQTQALNVLIQHPLPSLDHIGPLFASLSGFNVLLAGLEMAKNEGEHAAARTGNIVEILKAAMNSASFRAPQTSPAYSRELLALFCGSKLFNKLASLKSDPWSMEAYLAWLGGFIERLSQPGFDLVLLGQLILGAYKLNTDARMLEITSKRLFTAKLNPWLVQVCAHLRPFEAKQLVGFSIPYISNRWCQEVTVAPVAKLLQSLGQQCPSDLFRLSFTVPSLDTLKSLLWAVSLIDKHETFTESFEKLMALWGSKLNIEKTPISVQLRQTQIIYICLQLFDNPYLSQLPTRADIYLDSITNRLASPSSRARDFAMVIGEKIAQFSSTPLNFDFEKTDDWTSLHIDKYADSNIALLWDDDPQGDPDVSVPDAMAPFSPANSAISSVFDTQSLASTSQKTSGRYRKLNFPIRNAQPDSDDDMGSVQADLDEQEENSDDEDPTINKDNVRAPVFIRELLAYFKTPEKDDQYQYLDIALKTAPTLILQKARFGNEVKTHAKELARTLVEFKDNYDFPGYHKLRTQALVALVASDPLVAPYIVELFYTADITINDRLLLLTSLSLGARLLNGLQDDIELAEVEFPSKKLPFQIEDRFKKLDVAAGPLSSITSGSISEVIPPTTAPEIPPSFNHLSSVTSNVQRELLDSTIAESRENTTINGPKVLRVSSALQKQRAGGPKTTIITNKFAKVADSFIFPLIDGWWKSGHGIMAGTFSSIIQAHYFKTLALLLHSAAPSASHIVEMTSEVLAMLLKLRSYAQVNDPKVVEAACTCILVILDTNSDEFIVQKWPREFIDLQKWLEDTWEGVIDERVKGVAAGVLYKMTELSQKWQRSMIGAV